MPKVIDFGIAKASDHAFGEDWHDWIIGQLLMREAKALIEGGAKAPIAN